MSPEKYSRSNPIIKFLVVLMFASGLSLLGFSLYQKLVPNADSIQMSSQSHFVSRDIYSLYKKGKIPRYFFQLKSIKWTYYDKDLKKVIPQNSLPFKISPNGQFSLEVDAFSAPQENSKAVVLQMNLFDNKTKNKIFEMSRNYEVEMPKKNKYR